jgi:hypothetical protein
MAVELKGRTNGGPGKEAESVKPANLKEHRLDCRCADNRSGKRKAVVVIREFKGNSLPAVFRTEGAASSFIKGPASPGHHVAHRRKRRLERAAQPLRNEADQSPRGL